MTKFCSIAILTLLLILLSSCMDVNEEIWVNGDGSCRIKSAFSVDDQVANVAGNGNIFSKANIDTKRKQAEKEAAEHGRVIEEFTVAHQDGKTILTVIQSGTMDTASAAEQIRDDYGEILLEDSADALRWHRTLNFSARNGSKTDAPVTSLFFPNRFYTAKVHFDHAVLSSNGKVGATDKKTVEWTIPMATVLSQTPVLEASLSKASFSWGMLIGAGVHWAGDSGGRRAGSCCGALEHGSKKNECSSGRIMPCIKECRRCFSN